MNVKIGEITYDFYMHVILFLVDKGTQNFKCPEEMDRHSKSGNRDCIDFRGKPSAENQGDAI